ncbi:type ISP restriction/modification enzyme [Thiomicrospira sp. ALE5]|uniref:type ISP restriction/modification enzyme n=1 Tax=Thiomicrospira sp. ALE5 TaxID=748650 RepID=UPI0008DFC681|nr:type ISP restriction/modification enzyme [Thiomicrospira sp. ALE5]SFR49780.1 N-6 DNA Methylase [Thiomicrospira sp. ALE5]
MNVIQYIDKINSRLADGHTSEHTFRADLEQLLSHLLPDCKITNEPSKITDCGNPDFVVTRKTVPIGYIEAKDVGKDLNHKGYNEQFNRYKKALDNLIITDYIWFQFFVEGEKVAEVRLAQPAFDNPQKYEIDHQAINLFESHIRDFSIKVTQAIKNPGKLAELMAGKARLLESILEAALNADLENNTQSELTNQYHIFRDMLIHDLEPKQFADLYAQTLAYGMFAARYHDPDLQTFDRDEAARLIPKSNPLLRNLFQSIAGHNIDDRILTTVDNLAEVFRHTDVKSILHGYGKSTAQTDPIIHFYETFLAKYDPSLRKSRGVWYTPEPVVSFIVRAVDEILKTKFGLKDGLADTSKTKIELQSQVKDNRTKSGWRTYEKEVHRVQILDPATGTGTFLAEVVKYLYQSRFQHMQGIWPSYVEEHLIPRLNGFELLMASYAMAHLKLDMLLGETGYTAEQRKQSDNRLRIFLTNSLEEYHPDTHTLFSQWLSNESREANAVKKDTPVMVVIGNPPYSVSSTNKGEWIQDLVQDYKKDLNERNIQPLSDDYIKFIRYGQHFIEKNGEGVLAFITNNSFIDGLIHRQMRKHLLETFDEIYILDLHGNSKKKETAPDGSKDENVFDIMQGVSINLFIKNGSHITRPGELGKVYHAELFGKRKEKYDYLTRNLSAIDFQTLNPVAPNYEFFPKNQELEVTYKLGVSIESLMPLNATGITTERDDVCIHFTESEVKLVKQALIELEAEDFRAQYSPKKDGRDWQVGFAKADVKENSGKITSITYRPFDNRKTLYTGKSKGFMAYPRYQVMRHQLRPNTALLTTKVTKDEVGAFITNGLSGRKSFSAYDVTLTFPLYLYPEDGSERIPNLNPDEIKAFEAALNLPFAAENPDKSFVPSCLGGEKNQFTPIDILDYIYAVLHSPTYRDTYKEFLKTDFPRVPYPNPDTFWQLVELGDQIRLLHLMESPLLDTPITQYPIGGDNKITRKISKTSPGYEAINATHGKVWINDTQYFDNVPHQAWLFYIGGYQPAQKWLKDRQGRELSFDDILHYQKIIVALSETARLMQEVDQVLYPKD